jgi:hypothetical protein
MTSKPIKASFFVLVTICQPSTLSKAVSAYHAAILKSGRLRWRMPKSWAPAMRLPRRQKAADCRSVCAKAENVERNRQTTVGYHGLAIGKKSVAMRRPVIFPRQRSSKP